MGDKDLDGIPDHLDRDLDPDDLTSIDTFRTFEPYSLTAHPNDPMTFQAPMTVFRNPKFVQDHAGKNFSKGGQQYFEKATGTKYTTTRQLAEAIQKGLVDPSIVKVGTVNYNGST